VVTTREAVLVLAASVAVCVMLSGCAPGLFDPCVFEGNVKLINTSDATLHIRFENGAFLSPLTMESDVPPSGEFRWFEPAVLCGLGPRALVSRTADDPGMLHLVLGPEFGRLHESQSKQTVIHLYVRGDRIKAAYVEPVEESPADTNGRSTRE
jgi:hypothetical protein